jgi:hypothetical protein
MKQYLDRWIPPEEREKTYLISSKSWVGKISGLIEAVVSTVKESNVQTVLCPLKKWPFENIWTFIVSQPNPISTTRTINISNQSPTPTSLTKKRLSRQQLAQLQTLSFLHHKRSNRRITWNLNFRSLSTLTSAGLSMRTWWGSKSTLSISQIGLLKGRL